MKNQKHNLIKIIGTIIFIGLILAQSTISSSNAPEIKSNRFIIPIDAANHDPILINGNSELATFIENEGLSGDGTEGSPYIIEDFTIDASVIKAIDIQNTDAHLIIRKCTIDGVDDNYAGIYLNNTSNVNISNNDVSNYFRGIYIRESYNNVISENNVSNNFIGIIMYKCHYTAISKNIANYNIHYGITLSHSHNNTLLDNTADNNLNNGFDLSDSNGNLISGSVANNHYNGIELQRSFNNILIRNDIRNNSDGIFLYHSKYNKIYLNNIYENRDYEAIEEGDSSDNEWDNGTTGNYWGNYTEKYPDAIKDGIVWDTPYLIDEDGPGFDNFPLVDLVILEKAIKISGFPLINILIFVSVGVFLLRRKEIHRKIR